MVALSEVRHLGRGETRVDGYTYFWSGPAEGLTQGVVIAVANELIPSGFNAQLESSRTDFEDVVNPHGWDNRSSKRVQTPAVCQAGVTPYSLRIANTTIQTNFDGPGTQITVATGRISSTSSWAPIGGS